VGDHSAIEWTESTWNPTSGCDKLSPGCDHCYALTLAKRLKAMGVARYQRDGDPSTSGPGFGISIHPEVLDVPRHWRKPRTIFVNSMSDLFHPDVPDEFIGDVFTVMSETPQHTYQVLTKRSKRLVHLASRLPWPPNVWMGVTVESSRYRFRINHLQTVPSAIRFLSLEPLLGPLNDLDLAGIDWAIVGGESGSGHRPVDEDWITDIREQCLEAGVAFFFKQWGGRTPKANGRMLAGRTWDDLPVGRSH
jgi:protein gp37